VLKKVGAILGMKSPPIRNVGVRSNLWKILSRLVGPLLLLALSSPGEGAPLAFKMTGSLAIARQFHTATLLSSGEVLVVGGQDSSGKVLASAELYDPATGTWTTTGSLIKAREDHTATLLPNGNVLVTGGQDSTGASPSAELYDLATGSWSATGFLLEPRSNHTATCLLDLSVLVVGGAGASGDLLAGAEVYRVGFWAETTASGPRSGHTATLLAGGVLLVAGGYDNTGALTSAELFDPGDPVGTMTRIVRDYEAVPADGEPAPWRRIRYFFKEPSVRTSFCASLDRASQRIAPLMAGGRFTETQARVAANALVFGYFSALEQWYLDGGVRSVAEYVEEGLAPLRPIWSVGDQ